MASFNAEAFRKDLENIAHGYIENSNKLWLSYKIATNVALDSGDFRGIEALEAAAEAARIDIRHDADEITLLRQHEVPGW